MGLVVRVKSVGNGACSNKRGLTLTSRSRSFSSLMAVPASSPALTASIAKTPPIRPKINRVMLRRRQRLQLLDQGRSGAKVWQLACGPPEKTAPRRVRSALSPGSVGLHFLYSLYLVHHLANIGKTSAPFRVGGFAMASAVFLFKHDAGHNRRVAILLKIIFYIGGRVIEAIAD